MNFLYSVYPTTHSLKLDDCDFRWPLCYLLKSLMLPIARLDGGLRWNSLLKFAYFRGLFQASKVTYKETLCYLSPLIFTHDYARAKRHTEPEKVSLFHCNKRLRDQSFFCLHDTLQTSHKTFPLRLNRKLWQKSVVSHVDIKIRRY